MAIAINGDGTITGISVGGLPDGIVDAGTLATNSVDSAELIDGAVDDSHMAAMAASKLTGALPAISGASLTSLPAARSVGFSTYLTADVMDFTGNGAAFNSNQGGLSWSEQYDTHNGVSNGIFTCPTGCAGNYLFHFHTWLQDIATNMTLAYAYFVTSNYTVECWHGNMSRDAVRSQSFSTIASMDVGDTAHFRITLYYGGGNTADMKGVNTYGIYGYHSTFFQGHLLGG